METELTGRLREWLYAALAELIARAGHEPFVTAPLLTPSQKYFPDRWSSDVDGIRRLARRLLFYVGITDLRVEVLIPSSRESADFTGSATRMISTGRGPCYVGMGEGTCVLWVHPSLVADPEALTGLLGHEVAHVWRDRHGLIDPDPVQEECKTDVTTIYLGFGILTANAAYRYPNPAVKTVQPLRVGYLNPAAMTFLLAAQVAVFGEDPNTVRHWLAPTQAASFKAACREIDPGKIVERLGLPPPDDWPPPREFDLAPFAD